MPGALKIDRLGIKALWSLARDPIMIVLIVYTFTLSIYVSATAIPETLHKAPIAIVDEDDSALSARIAAAFFGPALPRARRDAAVRHHLDGPLHGHRRAIDAAIRNAGRSDPAAPVAPVREHHPAREHAGADPAGHADRSHQPLRLPRPGRPLPRSGLRRRPAAASRAGRDRGRVLRSRTETLSKNDRADGSRTQDANGAERSAACRRRRSSQLGFCEL